VSASLHAREIIRKLLLFARQTPTLKGRVDLNTVINEALGLFEHRLKKEAIELVRALSADLPELTADPGQMVQVLVNLVVNAIQAMPQGGTLVVETCERNGHVVCVVQDTGVGMAEEVLDRIFVPFFTTKDVNEGTGLGLPVVHGIVTSHGGTINVESKPGQGTRFEIRLPKEPQPVTESDSPL
jgi:signal transduction histidine kinase